MNYMPTMPDGSGALPSPLAGSRVPDAVLDEMLGLSDGGIPFVEDGKRPPARGPYVRKRKPSRKAKDRRNSYEIVDRTTEVEARILGHARTRHVVATGCKEGDEAGLGAVFAMYLANRRALLLASVMPMQVTVEEVLRNFETFLVLGAHDLVRSTVGSYRRNVRILRAYFGDMRLGEIRNHHFKDFVDWRTSQPNANYTAVIAHGDVPTVSLKQASHEMSTLRRGLSVFERDAGVKLDFKIFVKAAPRPEVVWLDRDGLARYLRAARGWTWDQAKGRWRIARDLDPSLTGPEGDRKVLQPTDLVEFRKAMARIMLMTVYSAGRIGTLLATDYRDTSTAHVDWQTGRLVRKGSQEDETNKGRGSVLLPAKLSRWVRNWARNDIARGITHPIHKPDGTPFNTHISPLRWRALDQDAGLGTHYTAHVGRHTCAHWLKVEGVSIWIAADFMHCSPEVLQAFYGRWDVQSHAIAAAALSGKSRQRDALRKLKVDGLR